MKIEIFTEFNDDLQRFWEPFYLQSNSLPFHSYKWQHYWNEHVGQPKYNMAICVVVCTADSGVLAIFPLGIYVSMGARVLSFMGAEESDYDAPLLSNDVDSNGFKDIWAAAQKFIPSHDVVFFRNIPEIVDKSYNFLLECVETKETGKSYSTTLPESFDDYSQRLPNSLLKDNRRMVRRLSEMGELTFKVVYKREEFNKTIETLISQKEARYNSSGARNIFNSKHIRDFYTRIFTLLDGGFNIHLSTLLLDDEILATHLGIHDRDNFYYLMPTFNADDKWRKFSLGRIHLERLVRWTIDNGITKFDFTIGGESYKSNWCNKEMAIYQHFKLRSPRGLFYFLAILLLEFVKSTPTLKNLAVKILSLGHRIIN